MSDQAALERIHMALAEVGVPASAVRLGPPGTFAFNSALVDDRTMWRARNVATARAPMCFACWHRCTRASPAEIASIVDHCTATLPVEDCGVSA